MALVNAVEEEYAEVTVFGKPALYTILRVDRDTVPIGLYLYHIRHSDDGDPCTVEQSVLANHMATILTIEPISLTEGEKDITSDDIAFLGNNIRLDEFLEKQNICTISKKETLPILVPPDTIPEKPDEMFLENLAKRREMFKARTEYRRYEEIVTHDEMRSAPSEVYCPIRSKNEDY